MTRWFIRACGLLIALRSLTNFAKLFQGDDATLVIFGQILHGGDAFVPAALVGAFMLVTGVAMLIGSRWAGPLVTAYAAYVALALAVLARRRRVGRWARGRSSACAGSAPPAADCSMIAIGMAPRRRGSHRHGSRSRVIRGSIRLSTCSRARSVACRDHRSQGRAVDGLVVAVHRIGAREARCTAVDVDADGSVTIDDRR
jgi:hypothetical protein